MVAAGFRAITETPGARLVVGLIVAQTFVRGCLNVLIVVAAFRVFDADAQAVGYMTAAIGVGGLVGESGRRRLRPATRRGIRAGARVLGLPIALIGPWPELAFAIAMLAVVGAANSVEDVAGFTLLQRLVPDRMLTRVLGVTWSLAMGGVALGSIAAPVLVDALGARAAFVAVGFVLPLLSLTAYRRLVAIDHTVAPAPELELIEQVPMFAPLSVAAKERVAANLVPLSVDAGQDVIVAGRSATASTSSATASSTSPRRERARPFTKRTTSARSRCCETCLELQTSRRSPTPSFTRCSARTSSRR